tara:strand:- start:274 stop:891 length:618 start_codon:yes stop_codon:yes gene_type:complete
MNKCWHTLPEDIINEMILYVPGYQNIYKVSLCCKKFSELLNFELYKLFIQTFSERFGDRLSQQVFDNEHSTRFSVLYPKMSDIFNFNLLLCAIRQMKKLEKLEIHCYTTFEQQDILKNLWIKRGNNLNKLYLQKHRAQNEIISKRNEAEKKLQERKGFILHCVLLPLISVLIEIYYKISNGNPQLIHLVLYFILICVGKILRISN